MGAGQVRIGVDVNAAGQMLGQELPGIGFAALCQRHDREDLPAGLAAPEHIGLAGIDVGILEHEQRPGIGNRLLRGPHWHGRREQAKECPPHTQGPLLCGGAQRNAREEPVDWL